MKFFLSFAFAIFTIGLFGQSADGFTIISQSNKAIKDASHFALSGGELIAKMKQMNTFSISFKDSIFVHTAGAHKSKEDGKKEMVSQVYKITNIVTVTDKKGVDLHLITIQSGLSGKLYDYYVEYNGADVHLSQIFDMSGNKDSGYKYSGILYEKIEYSRIRSFQK